MSRNRSTELEPLVNIFEHLSDKRRGPEALERLRKIASIVKPLMRQRDWTVGTLAEFYPSEHNLLGLNINRGQKICLRLRYPGDDTQFLPLENVVDTMLHELAHNVIGPHNQDFHALWDKLRDEHEALVRQGYTGEGFLGKGSRLGGRKIPLSEVKRQARAAAERRRNLTAGSGQKLGGAGIMRGQDPRAVIAAAAEKRMKIERGCASDTDRGRQIAREEEVKKDKVTKTTAEQEDEEEAAIMQTYIDMIKDEEKAQLGDHYIEPSQSNPAGSKGISSPPGVRPSMVQPTSPRSLLQHQREIEQNLHDSRSAPQPPAKRAASPPLRQASPEPSSWTCEICTLVNPLQYLTCDACGTERPPIYNRTPSPPPVPPRSSRRPQGPDSSDSSRNHSLNNIKERTNALKPRQKVADSLRKLDEQGAYKKNLPIGWQCYGCGNWMEQEWWTCSVCGTMKATS